MSGLNVSIQRQQHPGKDGSTTVTLGGTAQNLFGGAVPPHGYYIFNPHATETLWISESGAAVANAAGAIQVPALTAYQTPDGYLPVGAVSIIGVTTGHAITAKAW